MNKIQDVMKNMSATQNHWEVEIENHPGCRSESAPVCIKHKRKMRLVPIIGVKSIAAAPRWFCLQCAREEQDEMREDEDVENSKYKDQIKREKRSKEVEYMQQKIGVGKRYQKLTWNDYHPTCSQASEAMQLCKRYAQNFSNTLKNGDGLLLLGKPGTGKNHLSACICKEIVKQGHTALHSTLERAMGLIIGTWKSESAKPEDEISKLAEVDLLVLDEVGLTKLSQPEKKYLFDLVNRRYEDLKPTIMVSNLNEKQLEDFFDTRIYDRLCQTSFIIDFNWESWRRK